MHGIIKLPRRTEYRGAFFCKAAVFSTIDIVGKAPSVNGGLTTPAVRLGNGSAIHGGRFAMIAKVCGKCGQLKFIYEFHKNPKTKDGYYGACKSCCAKYQKKYRRRNHEKLAEDKRKYREENRDSVRTHKKQYLDSHREKESLRAIIWQKLFPEKVNEKNRVRRFRARANGGCVSKKQWQELCQLFEYRCAKCGEKRKLEMDHIVPVAKGGGGGITNVQPLCRSCNASKNDTTRDYRPAHIRKWAEESATWK